MPTDELPISRSTEGRVIRTESGFHRILTPEGTIVARAPKKLRRGERTTTTMVVIGDLVRVRAAREGDGLIEEILPRENELVRGAAGGSRFLDVIAANLDLLVAVHSLREPDFNGARLDRFLAMAEAAEIPALVVLNKLDLADEGEFAETAAPYRSAGYPVIGTSRRTREGVEELRDALTGRISAVVGPSGVGKSSLLNEIQPGLRLRTGEISEATGKGRHTTTTAELLPLGGGGYVADTPGLRELAIREVSPEDVDYLFPEFRRYSPECRFSDCTHRHEIGCSVRAAVERGEIFPARYRSYQAIFQEVEERDRETFGQL